VLRDVSFVLAREEAEPADGRRGAVFQVSSALDGDGPIGGLNGRSCFV